MNQQENLSCDLYNKTMDEENDEFNNIFNYFEHYGVENAIELTFNGDVSLAKAYAEQESILIINNSYCYDNHYDDNSLPSDLQSSASYQTSPSAYSTLSLPSSNQNSSSVYSTPSHSTLFSLPSSNQNSLSAYSALLSKSSNQTSNAADYSTLSSNSQSSNQILKSASSLPFSLKIENIIPYYLPCTGELRLPYLLRFAKLLQVAVNTGNTKMLKGLFDEVLADNCIFSEGVFPQVVTRVKICEHWRSFLKSVPDYYIINTNIKHTKRRIITYQKVTTGTMSFSNTSTSPSIQKVFETFIETMDENQKMICNRCKSQNKMISYERKSQVVFGLNMELTHIERFMAKSMSLKVYEFGEKK